MMDVKDSTLTNCGGFWEQFVHIVGSYFSKDVCWKFINILKKTDAAYIEWWKLGKYFIEI